MSRKSTPALLHRRDRADDVLACSAMCWTPGPWLNSRYSSIWLLRLPSAGSLIGNLILPLPSAITFDISGRVLGLDLVVAEMDDVRHPEDALVEADPVVHAAELDVADDVVERREPHSAASVSVLGRRHVAGQERPA